MRVPNIIAKEKIIDVVLDRTVINRKDLRVLPLLRFVADLLPQTIKHVDDHDKWNEDKFRDWVGLTFLQFPQLVTLIEQWTIRVCLLS